MSGRSVPRRPRIVDVALAAGVSAQTVSNVINGRGGFTDSTKARVDAAIDELGFQPNRHAQSLRSRRTALIGFVMASGQLDVSNPFTVGLLHALVSAAERTERRVLVFTHTEGQVAAFRRSAAAGLVDGFVLTDATVGDARAEVLDELGVPYVVMGRVGGDRPVASLDIDNAAAIRDAVDHVVGRGCRDVAYVGYSTSAHWDLERRRGVRDGLARHGLRLPRHRVLGGRSLGSVRARLPELLTGHGVPDAVVTSSDSIAVAVVSVAQTLGLAAGEQLAVTGFDDGPLATMVSPEITSVSIPAAPIAERLIDLLDGVLAGQETPAPHRVGTSLVVRDSSGFTPRTR